MDKWVDVTDTFSESERHYNHMYLEICEVFDDVVEANLFSSLDKPYEIYVSYGKLYGIVYSDKEHAYEIREQMKVELEKEYRIHKEPTDEFIHYFCETYNVCMPSDLFFDSDKLMNAFMRIFDGDDHPDLFGDSDDFDDTDAYF